MWGADTSLVYDALQIGAIMLAIGAGAAWFLSRKRSAAKPEPQVGEDKDRLEQRVRVLERIATDNVTELDAEIEALRTPTKEAN